MSTPPRTLPAEFAQWDEPKPKSKAAPETLPADFAEFDAAPPKKTQLEADTDIARVLNPSTGLPKPVVSPRSLDLGPAPTSDAERLFREQREQRGAPLVPGTRKVTVGVEAPQFNPVPDRATLDRASQPPIVVPTLEEAAVTYQSPQIQSKPQAPVQRSEYEDQSQLQQLRTIAQQRMDEIKKANWGIGVTSMLPPGFVGAGDPLADPQAAVTEEAYKLWKELASKDPESTGFFQGVSRSAKTNPASVTPYISEIMDARRMGLAYAIAGKPEDQRTPAENQFLDAYTANIAAAERFHPGIWDNIGSGAAESAKYIPEFGATAGVGRAAATPIDEAAGKLVHNIIGNRVKRWVARETMKATAENAGRGAVREAIMRTGEQLLKVPGMAVSGAVQAGINVPQIVAGALERMTPKFNVSVDDKNQLIRQFDKQGDSGLKAFAKSYGQQIVEFGSERAGAIVEEPLDILKSRLVDAWIAKKGFTSVQQALEFSKNIPGWNGLVGETFEELAGQPFQNLIEGKGPFEQGFSPEELAQTVGTVGVIGAAGGGAGAIQQTKERLGQGKRIQETAEQAIPRQVNAPVRETGADIASQMLASPTAEAPANYRPNTAEIPVTEHPEVPGGKVVGIDAESGLPIIRRGADKPADIAGDHLQSSPTPAVTSVGQTAVQAPVDQAPQRAEAENAPEPLQAPTPAGTPETTTEALNASQPATAQQGEAVKANSEPPATLPADFQGFESPASKQPWEMTQGYVALERAKQDFPIEGKVEVKNGKPVYTNSTTLKWGDGERTFEIQSRGPLNGSESARRLHKKVIEQAVAEGKPVPPEVLADYPDLQPVPKVERRVNLEQRKKVADMTPEERATALLTHDLTGLPNRRAFHEAEAEGPSPVVASSDADGLKAVNDTFGHQVGDELLKAKADALREAGLEAYHVSGDEFLYRDKSADELKIKLEKAREILQNKAFSVTASDGSTITLKGADFSYGTGTTLDEAEAGLQAHKQQRTLTGERGERGQLGRISRVGQEARGNQGNQAPEVATYQYSPLESETVPAGKKFYHGTQNTLTNLEDADPSNNWGELNIFGPGLYLTDNPNVASGYAATRKAQAGNGKVLFSEISGARVLDAEKPMTPEVRKVVDVVAERMGIDWLPENASLSDAYTEIRDESANQRIPAYEAQEDFGNIAEGLTNLGYDGLRHQGGKIAGKKFGPHNVVVLFPDFEKGGTVFASRQKPASEVAPEKPKVPSFLKPKSEETPTQPSAYELGRAAFERGDKRVPAQDKDFERFLKQDRKQVIASLNEWTKGWDEANLQNAAPEPKNNLTPTVESGSTIQPSEEQNAQPEQTRSSRTPESESGTARVAGETENISSIPEPARESGNAPASVSPEGNEGTASTGETGTRTRPESAAGVERPSGSESERGESTRSGGSSTAADSGADRVPGGAGETRRTGADGRAVESPTPEGPEEAKSTTAELRNQRNFRISDEFAETIGKGGEITKIKGNLDALELLKKIQAEGREVATPEEMEILSKYVDFGGLVGMLQRYWEPQYQKHYQRYNEILNEEERQEIRETLPNTHYTSLKLVDWMWRSMSRMGFKGGRILEPGMGIGNFMGRIPTKIAGKSELYGVERNPLTGEMAKLLYPDAKIVVKPFQQFIIPNNTLDAVIGNVPFQDVDITDDPVYRKLKLNLHNYFIVKSLDKLKPGGIMAVITSRYTMDNMTGKGQRAREEMAKRADLIAAIRLPDKAFKENAGTEVVTDLLIFQKRDPNNPIDKMPDWVQTETITVPGEAPIKKRGSFGQEYIENASRTNPKEFRINKYFVDNPNNVLGEHAQEGKMYGPGQYTVKPPVDFEKALEGAMSLIPKSIYGKVATAETSEAPSTLDAGSLDFAPEDVKPGAFYRDEKGNIKIKQAGIGVDLPATLNTIPNRQHIGKAIDLRDQLNRVIETQLETADDAPVKEEQEKLEKLYDEYRKKYGSLHGPKLKSVFGDDPEYPKLLALENFNTETKEIAKAAIFTKRVLAPYEPLRDLPDDPKSAMLKVMADRGYLDTKLMAQLLKQSEDDVVNRLTGEGLIFQDPQTGHYHTADEYLSGNVREKLRVAEHAVATNPKYKANVEALQKAQPKPLTIHDIQPNLGATWIPTEVYAGFIKHLTGRSADISRDATGKWLVQQANPGFNNWSAGGVQAHKLVQYALNQQMPTVWINHSDGTRTLDGPATTAARDKLKAIKEEFRTVLRGARQEVVDNLELIYNDTFNSYKVREFSGEHLDFPGMSEEWRNLIRGYQKAAVWRILQEGRSGLFHAPGLGKTLTMIAAGMEARRLKLSRKNLYAVPNHMVNQWREDFKKFYPNANVLAVQDEDFSAQNRAKLMSRIATGDWDAVIIPHSQFDLLPMSPEWEKKTIDKRLADYRLVLEDLDPKDDKRTIKQIEKAIDKLESRLNELNAKKKDKTIAFDQLGIDMMFVDEAHAYKAMAVPSKMGNIGGISNRASQRAFALEMKADYMRETHHGRGIVFGTGTPITNTVGELYVMTRYLAPEMLEQAGIRSFDDWAANFATTRTDWEYGADGVTFKPKTTLSEFVNVPELSTMFQRYAEYLSKEAAVKLSNMKIPDAERKDHMLTVTPTQEPLLQMIANRGQELTDNPPKTKEEKQADNWLKLSSDARKISLDPRLYNPDLKDDPGSKANECVKNIKQELDLTKSVKGTVVVFSDFFQHNDETGKPDFNLFEDMRKKLVKAGVPRDQIAIIHEAKTKDEKEALFAKVRAGKVRVIFGSTDKMGIGTNIQDRLYAEHHLDQPWRPDQVEQREGRIVRSGNMWELKEHGGKVVIHRYIAEPQEGKIMRFSKKEGKEVLQDRARAYDLQMYQQLARKASFQEQFLTGNYTGRTMEDVGGEVRLNSQMFELAKAMASGNQDALRKVKLEHDLRTYELLERNFQVERSKRQREIAHLEYEIPLMRKTAQRIKQAADAWKKATDFEESEERNGAPIEIDGQKIENKKDREAYFKAHPDIFELVGKQLKIGGIETEIKVEERQELNKKTGIWGTMPVVGYTLAGELHYVPYDYDKKTYHIQSFLTSFAQRARGLKDAIRGTQASIEVDEGQLKALREDASKTSPYIDKLESMQKEIRTIDEKLGMTGPADQDEGIDVGSDEDEEKPKSKKKSEEEDEDSDIPPGPGGMNVRSRAKGKEVKESNLAQLTAAVRRMDQGKPSLLSRIRNAGRAAREGVSAAPLHRALQNLKGASQALWQKYKTGAVAYTDWDSIVRSWSGAHQEVDLEARDFAEAVKKNIPDKVRREAMTNYLEAGGDISKLRDRADEAQPKFRAGYAVAMELMPDEETFVHNIENFMDADLEEAIKAGILEAGVENYIQHLWKRSASKDFVKKVMAEINYSSLQPNPSFSKKRVWETYFEGEQLGAEPVDKDIAFLATVHHQSLAKAIADRRFIKALFEGEASDGRPLAAVQGGMQIPDEEKGDDAYIIRPSQRNKETGDYVRVDHPALRRWKWVGKDEVGNQAFMQGDIIVHPDIAQKLKNVLGRSWFRNTVVGRGLLRGSTTFKHVLLAGIPSFFHQSAVAVHAMEHRVNPAFNVVRLDMSDPKQKKLVHSGIMVADFNAMEGFSEGLATGGIITKIPLYGRLVQAHTDYLFRNYIPRLKMTMALHALERNIERYKGELSEDKIYMLTADQANAAFGELNYKALSRNPTFQDGLRLFLLAPDFLEARARFAGQALRPYGKEQAVALALGAAVMYTLGRILSMMFADDHEAHFDKPFSAVIGKKEYSLRTVQGDVAHLVSNPRNFAYWRLNPTTTRTAMEWVTGRNAYGVKRDAAGQFKDFVEAHSPITGKPFFTRDPRKKRATWDEKLIESILQTIGINQRKQHKEPQKTRVQPKPSFFDRFKPKSKPEQRTGG